MNSIRKFCIFELIHKNITIEIINKCDFFEDIVYVNDKLNTNFKTKKKKTIVGFVGCNIVSGESIN